jgi:hypothetical protein
VPPNTQTANGDPLNGGGGLADRTDNNGLSVSVVLSNVTNTLTRTLNGLGLGGLGSQVGNLLGTVNSTLNTYANLPYVDFMTVPGVRRGPVNTETIGSPLAVPGGQSDFVSPLVLVARLEGTRDMTGTFVSLEASARAGTSSAGFQPASPTPETAPVRVATEAAVQPVTDFFAGFAGTRALEDATPQDRMDAIPAPAEFGNNSGADLLLPELSETAPSSGQEPPAVLPESDGGVELQALALSLASLFLAPRLAVARPPDPAEKRPG